MKKMIIGMIGLFASGLIVNADILTNTTISSQVDVVSSFVSRGRVFQDNCVLQPNITVNKQIGNTSIFVNDWENINSDRKHGNIFNETDLTIGGSTIGNGNGLTYTYGLINYIYSDMLIKAPVVVEDTRELYLGIATTYFGINPYATVYYDCEQVNGGYVVFGINHCFCLDKKSSLIVDTSIGFGSETYNEFYFGIKENNANDWSSGLMYNYSITSKAILSAGVRYSYIIDDEFRNNAEESYDGGNILIEKVSFIYNF